MSMNRRSFITGGVAALAGAALMGAAGCAPSPQSEQDRNAAAEEGSTLTYEDLQNQWAFEIAPDPIAESEIAETKEADLIVIGSGTSGLCCALSALQSGLDVILFSRSAAPVARGGSNFAVHSSYMEEIGAPAWDAEREMRAQLLHNSFDVDTRKWYRFYNNSEESMNWLIGEMAQDGRYQPVLETSGWGFPEDDPMRMSVGTHGWTDGENPGSQGQPHVVSVLEQHILDAGGTIDYSTVAQQLVRGEDNKSGRVTAVIAEKADGSYVKYVGAKAIVLATGDFSADRDMMARFAPRGLDLFTNWDQEQDPDIDKVYGGLYKGDGHKMGLWVGAAWQRVDPCPIMFSSEKAQGLGMGQESIVLDARGKRFFAEERTEGILGLVQRHCPEHTFFNIWGTNFASDYPYIFNAYGAERTPAEKTIAGWEKSVEDGKVVKADTLEELVAALGLPNEALAEIEKYNRFCEAGVDEDFHKRKEFLIPVSTGPFYGKKITDFTVLCVLGGLRTNQFMQVCDESDEPIPGLYNVGTMVGDSFANAYTFQIPGLNLGMNCVTFGYLTGKHIAENE